ncbi:MAG TPA: class I SAM-dependent methyltransferase [Candidatus Paceibacterota bacterium]|jgi:SAM-dependent methyltransferase|nr:class I SAM-dependent methyltransferase [Candidatus Paceibacterota bacterium]
MLSSADQRAVDYYNKFARGRTQAPPDIELVSDDFARQTYCFLPAVNRVVDAGCGYGRAVPLLRELGTTDYLGVDPSREQVRLARLLHPDCTFEVSSLYDLGTRHLGEFDGFFLCAVLFCIPRHRLARAFKSLRASLKQGATGLASATIGRGTIANTDGLELTLYQPQELIDVAKAAGFSVRDCRVVEGRLFQVSLEAV